MLIAVAAINADQSVPYCPLNAYKPIGRVLYLSDDVTISGQKKDFHEFTNVNIASDARPGFDIGKMILRKIATLLHPSILAASSISAGISANTRVRFGLPTSAIICFWKRQVPLCFHGQT